MAIPKHNVCTHESKHWVPVMRDALQGSLGTVFLVELGGLSDVRMTDGLMTLVDAVNLKGVSLLAREVLGLEAEGAGGLS